jgi:hypothetical protein
MNKTTPLLTVMIFLFVINGWAQDKAWETSTTKDNILVKSSVSDTIIGENTMQLIKYEASRTIHADYQSCINILKEIENYKHLFDYTKRSEKIKVIGTNEWLIYFYMDMPWPMSDSDAVYKMKLSQMNQGKVTQFEMISSPELMEYTDVKRGQIGRSLYHIEKLDNGQVFLKINTLSVPVSESPDWMVKAWFPEGPADIIRKIEELAQ